jgi:hypothetical protein
MERTPVKTIPIHEHLRPRLCDTYENDSIFDKFEVVFSGDAKNVMTGSYNNNFMIYPSDPEKDTEVVLQADKSAFKAKKVGIPTPMNSATSPTGSNASKKGGSRAGSPAAGAVGQGQRMRKETDADQIDFNKKILHMSWHPFEDSIAIAATNNVSSLGFSSFTWKLILLALCLLRLVRTSLRTWTPPWVYANRSIHLFVPWRSFLLVSSPCLATTSWAALGWCNRAHVWWTWRERVDDWRHSDDDGVTQCRLAHHNNDSEWCRE